MTPPRGKSPLDKPDKKKKGHGYNGASKNSIEGRLHRGELLMPGMNKQESIAAYRKWQKQFRIDGAVMEKWYRTQVQGPNTAGENHG